MGLVFFLGFGANGVWFGKKKRYLNHVLPQGKLYIHILIDMMIYDVMLNNYRVRFLNITRTDYN